MQHTEHFIRTFTLLGEFLNQFPEGTKGRNERVIAINDLHFDSFQELIRDEHIYNPWFTDESVRSALHGLSVMLREESLRNWLKAYEIPPRKKPPKKIGLVMAGNIPLAGFHDMLCVLASGHNILARPSAKDDRLLKGMARVMASLDPSLGGRLAFTEGRMEGLEAVIATGTDNSARYFEYYFRHIPHIIRKNRNGVAVLTGEESPNQLDALGRDVFTYFGLGCRNVTKLYIPANYDPRILLSRWESYSRLGQHNKYANNVEYYRTLCLMNRIPILDSGVLLLKEDVAIASPVGVVFYERYSEIEEVHRELERRKSEIQCCVSLHPGLKGALEPGTTQVPGPRDYADGIDTLGFLLEFT